jgi:hypothetical protein
MKVGDRFKLTEVARNELRGEKHLADVTHRLIAGDDAEITGIDTDRIYTTNGVFFYKADIKLLNVETVQPNYAAAFNAWMNDYISDPQAYESSHDSAVRHLKEKLNGEEPSYGMIAEQMLIEYLNKLESK